MITRRSLLTQALLMLAGCTFAKTTNPNKLGKLVVGVVAYGEGSGSIDRYQRFTQYLEKSLKTIIELEPAYNEVKSVEQIERRIWSLVFASPGLAAIAISKSNYLPLFPLQGVTNLSSVLVVLKNSPIQKLTDLNGKSVALGQPGSATGYYVPLYDLYGTSMSEIRIAPTPETVLEWVAKREVTAGALAKNELEQYRSKFANTEFRILHASRRIPPGAVLISPEVERNQQRSIEQVMNEATPAIAQEAGYITNAPPPDYKTLITFIQKVKPIEARIHEKPAVLYQ
ncbi:MAG: phosphate/phosphite/phosphonate ABC transporter substrate-binding protein [Leptolyngbyaceae cyanobacterium RU_5_1]|nr:phosphate/phosphite/phosphonate ABC transporter substrate-binding protein [Leptolyngbyaceae cyanobacterium RU_5_1]